MSNSCLIVGRGRVYLTYNSPLLGDASAARAASTSSCYAITKHNAVLTNHHFQCPLTTSGLSRRWNSTALLPPLSLPFAHALCVVGRTKTAARRRTVRVRRCHRLLRAMAMPRTRGIMIFLEEQPARGQFTAEPAPPFQKEKPDRGDRACSVATLQPTNATTNATR